LIIQSDKRRKERGRLRREGPLLTTQRRYKGLSYNPGGGKREYGGAARELKRKNNVREDAGERKKGERAQKKKAECSLSPRAESYDLNMSGGGK